MIIVSGTKRSGTSLWMQILAAAGFPVIGKAFLGDWEQAIKEANPRGFYESVLRDGIYYATNPDPKSGEFIFPNQSREHVIKVFIPGLIRTDYAFLDRVLVTMRPWRTYCASLERLRDMEIDYRRRARTAADDGEARADEHSPEVEQAGLRKVPLSIEWWHQYYDVIRDVAVRRYPFHLVSYDRVLGDPETEIGRVLAWIGRGDLGAACKALEPELNHDHRDWPLDTAALEPDWIETFDELYDHVHRARGLDAAFLGRMNEVTARIAERFGPLGYRKG